MNGSECDTFTTYKVIFITYVTRIRIEQYSFVEIDIEKRLQKNRI